MYSDIWKKYLTGVFLQRLQRIENPLYSNNNLPLDLVCFISHVGDPVLPLLSQRENGWKSQQSGAETLVIIVGLQGPRVGAAVPSFVQNWPTLTKPDVP